MAISTAQANMIGTVIELVMMGAYIMMFVDHMKIMYQRCSTHIPYTYLLSTSVAIFTLALLHAITQTWRIYTGFTSHMNVPNAPVYFYNKNDGWDSWVGTLTYVFITLVSDMFFVYRTWVVWGRNYLVSVIPFFLFLGDVAMAIYLLWSLSLSTDDPCFVRLLVASTSKYFFSVTLALTLACTLLIAFKLWSVARHVRPILSSTTSGGHIRLSRIATIIFESAAIYSLLLVAMIITDVYGIPSFFILFKMLPPVIGIVFSSIIVSMSIDTRNTPSGTITSPMWFGPHHWSIDGAVYTATAGPGSERAEVDTEVITESSIRAKLKVSQCRADICV